MNNLAMNVKKCKVCSYTRNMNKTEFNVSLRGEKHMHEDSIMFDTRLTFVTLINQLVNHSVLLYVAVNLLLPVH